MVVKQPVNALSLQPLQSFDSQQMQQLVSIVYQMR